MTSLNTTNRATEDSLTFWEGAIDNEEDTTQAVQELSIFWRVWALDDAA